MFKLSPIKKIEKAITKALKIVNKEFCKNKYGLGRYCVRDCFHQTKQTKENDILVSYCFECVDKAIGFRKFYGFSLSVTEQDEVALEHFVKTLSSLLTDFSNEPIPAYLDKPIEQKDFRHTKID